MLNILKNFIQNKIIFSNIAMDREKNIELYRNSRLNKKINCPNRPLHLFVEVTSRCNLSCKMCNIHYSDRKGNDINELLLESTYLFANTAKIVQPFGLGEPLLHPMLSEIIRIYKSKGAFVSIVSNGMLLKPVLSEEFIECGLDQLVISIDAADEELFKEIRRGADLNTIKNNIKILNEIKKSKNKNKPDLAINVVVQKSNFHELADIIRLAKELEIYFITFSPIATHEHISEIQNEAITPETLDWQGVLKRCFQEGERNNISINAERLYYILNGLSFKDFYKDKIPCPEPFRFMGIRANGEIFPCCNWDVERPISNVILNSDIEDKLMEIWQCKEWNKLRESIMNNNYPEICKKCMKNFTRPFIDEYI